MRQSAFWYWLDRAEEQRGYARIAVCPEAKAAHLELCRLQTERAEASRSLRPLTGYQAARLDREQDLRSAALAGATGRQLRKT
jgi:hypothetical protein